MSVTLPQRGAKTEAPRWWRVLLAAAVIAAATAATASTAHARDRGDFTVAARTGAVFPQPFSSLETSYLAGAELGWIAPFWKRHLAIAADVALTAPEADGGAAAPGTMSGGFRWHLVEREVTVGLYVFLRHRFGRFTPYLGGGPRVFVLEAVATGSSGGDRFAPTRETQVTVGGGIVPGVGGALGPGQVFVELPLAFASSTQRTTGAASVSTLALAFGYRVLF
jgi:outer membrane protein W